MIYRFRDAEKILEYISDRAEREGRLTHQDGFINHNIGVGSRARTLAEQIQNNHSELNIRPDLLAFTGAIHDISKVFGSSKRIDRDYLHEVTVAAYVLNQMNRDLTHLGCRAIEEEDLKKMAFVAIGDWLCPEQLMIHPYKKNTKDKITKIPIGLVNLVDPNTVETAILLFSDLTVDHKTGEQITYEERLQDLAERKFNNPEYLLWRRAWEEQIGEQTGEQRIKTHLGLIEALLSGTQDSQKTDMVLIDMIEPEKLEYLARYLKRQDMKGLI